LQNPYYTDDLSSAQVIESKKHWLIPALCCYLVIFCFAVLDVAALITDECVNREIHISSHSIDSLQKEKDNLLTFLTALFKYSELFSKISNVVYTIRSGLTACQFDQFTSLNRPVFVATPLEICNINKIRRA
jgi:hypothetical protein